MTTRPPVKGSNSTLDSIAELTGAKVGEGTGRLYSPTMQDIPAWRERLATKYHDRLEEDLTWDESTALEVLEDLATTSDVMFHHVAAVLDSDLTERGWRAHLAGRPPRSPAGCDRRRRFHNTRVAGRLA